MDSVAIVLLGIAGMVLGWFVYSRFIAERMYRLDPNFRTPAHEFNDGVDFVPTNKFVLWVVLGTSLLVMLEAGSVLSAWRKGVG